MLFQVLCHFRAEFQLEVSAAVNFHGFCPHLPDVGSGSSFVLQNVNLRLLRVHHDRNKAAVAGTVKGQEVQRIGCAAKYTLSRSVCRVCFVGDFVNLLLAAQEGLDFLNALGVGGCHHLGHFNNPVSLQFAVYIVIVQFSQIIRKPLIPESQQPEECGLSRSLTAYQTKHDFKLAAGLKSPRNRPQHKQFQGFIAILADLSSKEVVQGISDAFRSVPRKAVQAVPDWMVLIFIRHNPDGVFNLFLTGQPIIFFQIKKQIFHIRICQGCTCSVIADGLNDVLAVSQAVISNRPGKHRVTLKHCQTVADALPDTALLRAFQFSFHFFNAPGRLHGVYCIFHVLLHLGRQVLIIVFQALSHPFRIL